MLTRCQSLRRAWETRGASVNTIEEAMMPPAKRVKTGTKFPGEKAAEIQSFDVNKAPKVPKGKGRERAVTFSDNAEPEHALEPETPHPRPTKPHSRAPDNLFTPGPGPAPHRKATFIPDSPLTPEEASPVKFGGIADHKDGSDDEEQIAAKLSPVKAGRRVTSTVSCYSPKYLQFFELTVLLGHCRDSACETAEGGAAQQAICQEDEDAHGHREAACCSSESESCRPSCPL